MNNIFAIRGDTETYTMTFVDPDTELELDLTDYAIAFTARETYSGSAIFEKAVGTGIVVADPSSGVAVVTVDPTDTDDLPLRRMRLVYDVELTKDGVVKTPIRGNLIVLPDVTNN